MSAAATITELQRLGIQLEADGDRLRYRPQSGLPPELLARLKAHKAELLALLRLALDPPALRVVPSQAAPAIIAKRVCKCGSTTWLDVPIHNGQSIRRDCGRCKRFLEFAVWHGMNAGHKGQ